MGKYGLAQGAGFFGETPSDNQLTIQRSGLSLYPEPLLLPWFQQLQVTLQTGSHPCTCLSNCLMYFFKLM